MPVSLSHMNKIGSDQPSDPVIYALTGVSNLLLRKNATIFSSWVGNFIIRANGSDKQMLCASSGACVALNIAAGFSKQKR